MVRLGRAKRVAEKGFTLVEILAVIAIFGVAMLSLSRMFVSIQQAQRNSRYMDLATQAARNEIEQLRGSQANTLTLNQTIDFSSSLPAGLPAGTTASAITSQPTNAPGSRQVDVTVRFSSPAGSPAKTVALTAYIDPQVSTLQ